jgi:hypothetical protein
MIIILLADDKNAVIPILKPTVLYAENVSNVIAIKLFPLSNIEINQMAIPMTRKDKKMVANALLTEISEISLRNNSKRVFPFDRLIKFNTEMAKTDVFIPPPVEAGEAPIHIKKMINKIVLNSRVEKSIELNPAVLGVVEVKRAVTILPKGPCSANVLLYSTI